MTKTTDKLVQCRYPKCSMLHENNKLLRSEAVQGDSKNYYYHPDCYHISQTVNQIKDLFYRDVNPLLTSKQIGQLVSIVNNMIFKKNLDVDYILFALKYFIKNKPGILKYPGGITYIVQDKNVESAWKKEQDQKIRAELNAQMDKFKESLIDTSITEDVGSIGGWTLPENESTYQRREKSKFSSVLGV